VPSVAAQAGGVPASDPDPIRVFLDCRGVGCDADHLRREIRFVTWVRDPRDADVHVIVSSRTTGGGGRELDVRLVGADRRAGVDLKLQRIGARDETAAEIRSALTRTMAVGLAALSVGTSAGEDLQVVTRAGALPAHSPEGRGSQHDPWRAWVFRVGLSGSVDGEESVGSSSFIASLSATHTTDRWKIQLRSDGSRNESRFQLSDSVTLVSRREGYSVRALVARSLGDNVSTGIRAAGANSTFLNQDLRVHVAPAVEYSVFPYAESTARQLVVRYSPGVSHYRFTEETIYGVLEETLGEHALSVGLDLLQPWGSASFELEGRMLMSDRRQNQADLSVDLSWRVVRGFSLSVMGIGSHVANQRNLPRGGATDEEILLRRRELATSFRYHMTLGFGYTFGSRFAGPVNPRLGS
jgi:hypothetical protein